MVHSLHTRSEAAEHRGRRKQDLLRARIAAVPAVAETGTAGRTDTEERQRTAAAVRVRRRRTAAAGTVRSDRRSAGQVGRTAPAAGRTAAVGRGTVGEGKH